MPSSAGDGVARWALWLVGMVAVGIAAVIYAPLEWCDAFIQVLVTRLHARTGVHEARLLSQVGPYLGAQMTLVALVVARRRGVRLAEIRAPLLALALALLCVELLKLAVYRDRPFPLEPAQHDSFPSGDTAQVALCAATALHLIALRHVSRDWLRTGMALVGMMAAVAIGIARVYLSRHWVSDVGISLLIGLAFWRAAPRWRVSVRKFGLALGGIVVLIVTGPRVVLPSPRSLAEHHDFTPSVGTGLPFYLQRAVPLVSDDARELTSNYIVATRDNGDHGRGSLVPEAALGTLLVQPAPVYVLTSDAGIAELHAATPRKLTRVYVHGRARLLRTGG